MQVTQPTRKRMQHFRTNRIQNVFMSSKTSALLTSRNDLTKEERNSVAQTGSKEKWLNKIFKNTILLMIMLEGRIL